MRHAAWLAVAVLGLFVPASPAEEPTFEKHVRPILKANCFECHGEGEKLRGGLDLRLQRFLVKGGESGAAVEPGKADKSLLLEKVRAGEMPPGKKKLSTQEIALLERWVKAGAKTAGAEPESIAKGLHISTEDRTFWAFQPVRRPGVPRVKESVKVRNPVDAFLLVRLEKEGLTFAPEADRVTLIRRATFDLHGLPPTPEEIEAFVNDAKPRAYERLIDRLLASPRYGERWGRHWLDVAGYADSDGYTSEDYVRPYTYKYRDYVIRSFSDDKPFDQFIVEQLAGDELVKQPHKNLSPAEIEKLTATGFLRMAPDGTAAPGVEQGLARNQVVADTLRIVSTSLIGMTLTCAQCHNHRYDPIPQSDYYRLRAVFEPALDWKAWKTPAQRLVSLYTDADRAKSAEIETEAAKIDKERLAKQQEYMERTFEEQLKKLPGEMHDPARAAWKKAANARSAEEQKLFRDHPNLNVSPGSLYLYDKKAADDLKAHADRAAAVRATKPKEDFVHALTEIPGKAPTTFLFHRGDHEQPKEPLTPGGMTVLDERLPLAIPPAEAGKTTGRRLALARWLTDPRHPLTARVLVNRVWMHHFGRGIVATPGDFGQLGDRPTHPELLDWLASEFVGSEKASGGRKPPEWSLKSLHRLLMTSTAYRQSAKREPAKDRLDPDNKLLGRMPVRRLEAEAVRDALLAVSGKLNLKPFGPPVPVKTDEVGRIVVGVDNLDGAGYETGKGKLGDGEENRRSVWVQVRRSRTLSLLETFDAAPVDPNCEVRNASTVAPQSLLLMNDRFVSGLAEAMADRVAREAGDDPKARVVRAWRLTLAREPSATEVTDAVAFLKAQEKTLQVRAAAKSDPRRMALASFCHALVSSNGFLYVD